ncbi:MAG: CYTH domain-containing protein [Duncaniella sp.]|nr:CYTH domain-containing protein [Duncaniella sp.]
MAKEIERKFLVVSPDYRMMATESIPMRQTYLSEAPRPTVRIRVGGAKAWLTVKGLNHGLERDEWEYEIPVADADHMAERLVGGWSIDKTRYIVPYGGWRWEVDEFHGHLEGLVVAEVEISSEDCNPPLPPFVDEEVTGDVRYYNSSLARCKGVKDLE